MVMNGACYTSEGDLRQDSERNREPGFSLEHLYIIVYSPGGQQRGDLSPSLAAVFLKQLFSISVIKLCS